MARVISGLALLATLVLVVWFLAPWGTLALALGVAILATREFFALARRRGESAGPGEAPGPAAEWAMVAAVCAVCAAAGLGARLEAPLLAAMVLAGALAVATGHPSHDVMRGVAVLALPVLYLGVPLGVLVLLRAEWGPGAVFTAVLGVAASDIAQFYGGKAFGRRKLAPVISPKKTVEGAVSGFLGAAVALPLFGWLWLPGWPSWVLALVGAALAAAGIVGDLFESLVKRSAGVKDSSALIPGHGGVLDRIDALLFAGPLLYVILRYGGVLALPLPPGP